MVEQLQPTREVPQVKARQILFSSPNHMVYQEVDFDVQRLEFEEIAVRTHYSLISPGTELSCLSGEEGALASWAQLPMVPGYVGCGEILAVGPGTHGFEPGQIVLAGTGHASHVKTKTTQRITLVPAGLDHKKVCFAQMASIAITALRVSEAELGDYVAVVGLGLVGNLAAQFFALAGCQVIGIDPMVARLKMAGRTGIELVINPDQVDVRQAILDLTCGRGCEVVVEATGIPALALQAAELVATYGDLVLLGSPRQPYVTDVTDLLRAIHLKPYVTVKGALTGRYPARPSADGYVKHSVVRNVGISLGLIAGSRLRVEELITHVLPPEECERAYDGLRTKKDEYMGVLFDWTTVS